MAALCALLAVAPEAGARNGRRPLEFDGHIEVSYRDRHDERTRERSGDGYDREEQELLTEIQVIALGYVYHPRFMTYRIAPSFTYRKDLGDTLSSGGRDDRSTWSGDFYLRWFEQHPVNFGIRGVRTETELERDFARSFLVESETLGGHFEWRNKKFPIRLTYVEGWRRGAGAEIDEEYEEAALHSSYRWGARSEGHLDLRNRDFRDGITGRDLTTRSGLFDNLLHLGGGRGRLGSFASYRDVTGTSESTVLNVRELFGWNHTKNLSTRYTASYYDQEVGEREVKGYGLDFALDHQLYQSLHTSFELFGSNRDSTSERTNRYGAALTERYSKRLGKWGRLGLGLRGFTNVVDTDPREEIAPVLEERHVLTGGLPAELERPDVLLETIVVTDETGQIEYRENEDYDVTRWDRVTLISRLPLGRIPDGDAVLVSYDYFSDPPGEIQTTGWEGDFRLDVRNWLSVYGRHIRWDQELLSGIHRGRLEDLERSVAGIRLGWRRFSVGYEYEERFSVYSSFERQMGWLSLSVPFSRRWRMQLSGRYSEMDYTDRPDWVDSAEAYLLVSGRMWGDSWLEVEGEWAMQRWDETNDVNDLDAYGVRIGYNWRIRDLILEASYRLSRVEQGEQEDDTSRLFLLVRREF